MREALSRRAVLPAAAACLLLAQPARELAAAAPPPRPFLVTGSSSGIGRAATLLLSAEERFVLCAARTAEAAQGVTAAQGDASLGGYGLALGAGLDLADLTSVSAYVERLYQELPQGVEGALLCAGVEALPLRRTPQGFEATFAVNVLSHFVLAAELAARAGRPASSGTGGLPWASSSGGGELGEPAKVGRPCRLVSVTSSAAFDSRLGEGDALDLNCLRRAYDPRRAYVDSKACNVLLKQCAMCSAMSY